MVRSDGGSEPGGLAAGPAEGVRARRAGPGPGTGERRTEAMGYVDAVLHGQAVDGDGGAGAGVDGEALDAYARVVTSVAERLIPSVSSLRVTRRVRGGRRAEGAGSAVAITPDGFLLTS